MAAETVDFVVQEPTSADSTRNPAAVAVLEWRGCVHAIAQQPVMRVARDGRRFPARGQRELTATPPATQPAAVPTWGRDGTTRLLVVDLDSKRGDVAGDAAAITAQLEACGAQVVADESPSGGRHLYVVLQVPVTVADMNPVAHGLAARWPSVDVAPMLNVAAGYIRPPGSRHHSGGWQRLLQPLSATLAALSTPAPPQVWDRIRAKFTPPPGTVTTPVVDDVVDGEQLAPLPGYDGQISGRYAQMALTGDWSGYKSPSEARQGVVWAAVAAGMTLTTVARRIATGAWPGLASLYARYGGRHEHRALARDWRKAITFEKRRRDGVSGQSLPHECTTRRTRHRPQPSGGPAATSPTSPAITQWLTAVHVLKHRWARDPAAQLVLRALAQAAQQTGSTEISRGLRGLAIATQTDHTTVSRTLARLRDETDPVITRVAIGRGVAADTYALVVPDSVATSVTRVGGRRRQVRALHPVARSLGRAAGWIHEALREQRGPLSVLDVVERVPYGESAVRDALHTLAAWDLARHDSRGWCVAGNASVVAIRTGADIDHQAVVDEYRAQRRAWHDRLGIIPWPVAMPSPPANGPPNDIDKALSLLKQMLGAEEIAA